MEQVQQAMIYKAEHEQPIKEETKIQSQINDRDMQEELLWKQKSRLRWLKEGEGGTKFFHISMVQRRHQNHITSLKYSQGKNMTENADIEQELVNLFESLLTEP
jgi:hypothetical protein